MQSIDRNQKIYVMRQGGAVYREIAEAFGMSITRVKDICDRMEALDKERPLPPGVSLRTAKAVEWSFGVWPSDETAGEIAGRRQEWLRGHGIGLRQVRELERWLASKGIPTD